LAYIRGETREAGIGDDVSRDIEALVGRLDIAKLGFVRAEATLVLQPETHAEGLRWYSAPGRVGNEPPQCSANNDQKQKSDAQSFRASLSPPCCRPFRNRPLSPASTLGTADKLEN